MRQGLIVGLIDSLEGAVKRDMDRVNLLFPRWSGPCEPGTAQTGGKHPLMQVNT
jgi:hypothetical protein